jgi:hypothetical protein
MYNAHTVDQLLNSDERSKENRHESISRIGATLEYSTGTHVLHLCVRLVVAHHT